MPTTVKAEEGVRRMKKPQIRKKTVVIIGAVVVVAIIVTAVLLLFLRNLNEKTVNIDGIRIDRNDYNAMRADAEKDTSYRQEPEKSKQTIAISVKSDEIAKKYKLGITQEMLEQRSKTLFDKEWAGLNNWQRSAVETTTLLDYAYFLSKGGSEVYIYEFPFAAAYAVDIKDVAKNMQAIASADQKAKQDATALRAELLKDKAKAGSLTIKLRNDPAYAEGYGFAMNPSRWFFMTDDAKTYESGDPENEKIDVDEQVAQQVKALKPGATSEVITRVGEMPVDPRAQPLTFAEKPIAYRVMYVSKKVTAQKDVYNQIKQEIEKMKIGEIQ